MKFSESDAFKKECKKLSKKYRTLPKDLDVVKKAITATPQGDGSKHWDILKYDGRDKYIMKMRMMCRAVRGAQFRVIYFYDGADREDEEDKEKVDVLFIELYFKGDKANEDRKRIEEIYAKMCKS